MITLGIATLLSGIWLVLLFMAGSDDWIANAYAQIVDNRIEIERLRLKDEEREAHLNQYHGVARKVMGLLAGKNSKRC